MTTTDTHAPETVVLHVGGLHYASEKAVVEGVLALLVGGPQPVGAGPGGVVGVHSFSFYGRD